MYVGGTVISSVEFHGNMSLVIFMSKCPLACRYCHNAELLDDNTQLSFEEIKKEIDWSKIQRGTKVQVRNYEEREWKNAYFIKYNSQEPYYPFVISSNLDDDFSSYKMEHNRYYARHCRIHPSVEIPDEWYKEVKE